MDRERRAGLMPNQPNGTRPEPTPKNRPEKQPTQGPRSFTDRPDRPTTICD